MAQSLLANVKSQTDFRVCLVEAFSSRITGAASYFGGAFCREYLKFKVATGLGLGSASQPLRVRGLPLPGGREIGEQRFGLQVEALQRRGPEGVNDGSKMGKSGDMPALETGAWLRGKPLSEVENDPLWEQIEVGLRLTYAAGVYGLMALAGLAICHFTGIDNNGGFELCPDAAMQGLGYAVPPMMALLFILDDEVVKKSPPARAIRDVEDDELLNFFVGMSPWQLMFVVALGSAAEELFFRIAVQGGLAHVFLSDEKVTGHAEGIAALTGVFPCFAPFAHALAAVLAAALTGSILFITSFPQDPKYVIAPVHRNLRSQRDMKRSFAAWYERRQLRKIYSPLLDSFLALYLGFEWIQKRIAIRVLSQDCSSSPCERNWSTWALFHTKKRNKLKQAQLERLVFCHCNLQLLEKSAIFLEPSQVNINKIDIEKIRDIPTIPQEERDIYSLLYEELSIVAHNTRAQRRLRVCTSMVATTETHDDSFSSSQSAGESDEELEDDA